MGHLAIKILIFPAMGGVSGDVKGCQGLWTRSQDVAVLNMWQEFCALSILFSGC